MVFLDTIVKKQKRQLEEVKLAKEAGTLEVVKPPTVVQTVQVEQVEQVVHPANQMAALSLPRTLHARIDLYLKDFDPKVSKRAWVAHALDQLLKERNF